MATASIRESQADLMAKRRKSERNVEARLPVSQQRRDDCEHDDALWLRTYLPGVFYNPFTKDQLATIEAAGQCLKYGIAKCKAAPRGDGKSSILKYLTLKYSLYRQIRFVLLLCATGPKSNDSLSAIKQQLRKPDGPLWEDFPFECDVARYVGPAPARANNVTYDWKEIKVEWASNRLILPSLSDAGLGPVLMALGYESDQLQGCNVYDVRPDFVLLDDLDSRDSLAAVDGVVAQKILTIIDQTVGGLGGPGRRLGQFYLGTVTSRSSACYVLSDTSQKPAWSGQRTARIIKWPDDTELWEEYIGRRQTGQKTLIDPTDPSSLPIDPFGRGAHQFLVENFDAMHAGAVLSNNYDFEQDLLPDGTPKHLSALQKCYDYIADKGMESFLTEHQNDPPEETGPVESGITPHRLQKQVNELDRREIAPDVVKLTRGIDVRKTALHWVVRAWKQDGTGYTIDYGVFEIHGTTYGSDEGLDIAIKKAILGYLEESKDLYERPIDRTLIDAGYRTDAVYQACAEAGLGVMPVMGFGKSTGCVQANFQDIQRRTRDRKPGDGWFLSKKGRLWLVCADTDRWKAWEHDRWMTGEGNAGRMSLFGKPSDNPARLSDDEKAHHSYARHICNEVEVEEPYQGTMRRRWKAKSENTHWFDASYYADVAANMEGIRVLSAAVAMVKAAPSDRPTAAQLAARLKK